MVVSGEMSLPVNMLNYAKGAFAAVALTMRTHPEENSSLSHEVHRHCVCMSVCVCVFVCVCKCVCVSKCVCVCVCVCV